MRTALYLVTLFVATLWYGGKAIVARMLRVPRRPGGFYDRCQRDWARIILRAAGASVTVEGGERLRPDEPEIIAANHASFFDILALMGHLPVGAKFVAKKELFSIPVFGDAMLAIGHVRMDRQRAREAFGAYEVAARRVRDERLHVLVYPEGTRTRTGELLPFKKGPFVLAIACGAPIVPVWVDGAFAILPKGRMRVSPGPMRVRIGERIPTAGLTYDDRDELSARTRNAMLALRSRVDAPGAPG